MYRWAGSNSNFRSSRKPCFETYIGRSPWSEPETRALRDFILYGANANFVVTLYIIFLDFIETLLKYFLWPKISKLSLFFQFFFIDVRKSS